jgi:protein TonB
MNREVTGTLRRFFGKNFLTSLLAVAACAGAVSAQFSEEDALTGRLNRARALAAANNLPVAAKELEAIRAAAKDEATRAATAIMLMSLYFEQANYGGAQALLDESFAARAKNAGSYFATAGQSLRGVRGRLERYRLYSLNVGASDLPDEAVNDLNRMRGLLERMAEQAKAINKETPNSFESPALLEDIATLRTSLARDDRDRAHWSGEVAAVRGRMVESEARITISGPVVVPSAPPANSATTVTVNNPPKSGPSAPSRGGKTPKPAPTPAPKQPEVAKNNPEPQPPVVLPGNSRPAPPETSAAASPKTADKPVSAPPTEAAPVSSTPNRAISQPVEVGQLAYKASQKRNPTYPVIAKNARVTGQVKVFLEVDEKGSITRVKGVEGPVLLQRAAEDAARGWKFNQTVIEGQSVRVTGFIIFNFVL